MADTRSIDQLDKKILRLLQSNGRISNRALAEAAGLSASPCWQRVRRLEQDGYIKGCSAALDHAKLGVPEIVVVELLLENHDLKTIATFSKAIDKIPNILEAHMTTGDYDFLIKVAVSGTEGYSDLLINTLYKIPGIRQTRSSFTLNCSKRVQAFIPD